MDRHRIIEVEAGSIAQELGLEPGDFLCTLNGQPVRDVLDYRYQLDTEALTAVFASPEGFEMEAQIEKDVDEDLGLVFETGLMSRKRACANHCVFCFIDQLPQAARDPLHFKDDDWRLSFLQGNYVTLTNVSDRELQRIVEQQISPLYISVHAMDMDVRVRMMRNERARLLPQQLQTLCQGGIDFYAQIVLCPGWNDGRVLDETMQKLYALRPHCRCVAIVPVGLTEHREGLCKMHSFDAKSAARVVAQVQAFHRGLDEPFVFLADEFYLMAGAPIPEKEMYGDFALTEDGIGMLRLLETQFDDAIVDTEPLMAKRTVTIATGEAAYPTIVRLCQKAQQALGVQARVVPVKNVFFGGRVNVTGLLTATCLKKALAGRQLGDALLISRGMLRGDDLFLDDCSLQSLQDTLGTPIVTVPDDGGALLGALLGRGEGA